MSKWFMNHGKGDKSYDRTPNVTLAIQVAQDFGQHTMDETADKWTNKDEENEMGDGIGIRTTQLTVSLYESEKEA